MKAKHQLFLVGSVLFLGMLACNLPKKSPEMGVIFTATSAPTVTSAPGGGLPSPVPSPTPLAATATPQAAPSATAMPTSAPTSLPPSATLPPQLTRSVGKVVASYLANPPTIDGDLSEWNLTAYAVNAVTFGADKWSGQNDLSGSVMIGWNETYLYLGVHVTDDVFVQNVSGSHLYEGDSIEVLLDTKLGDDFYTNTLSPDDFQLGMSPGVPTIGDDPEAYLWLPRSIEGYRPEVTVRAKKTSVGYDMEVSIPWKVFEMTPLAGWHYGFCFSISDNDKVGGIAQQSLASNVATRHLTMPNTWGDLLLSK